MPFVLENAIYSKTGKWGVIISHTEHALIGGEKSFVEKYLSLYHDAVKDVNNFKEYYKEAEEKHPEFNFDWVTEILEMIDN